MKTIIKSPEIKFIPVLIVYMLIFLITVLPAQDILPEDIDSAGKLIGLHFSKSQKDSMRQDLIENLESYLSLRKFSIPNSEAPVLLFNPYPPGFVLPAGQNQSVWSRAENTKIPENPEDLAYYSIGQLAELLRTRKITSLQLTEMYLARLKKYGPRLECVTTLTEELALKQARRADAEIAAGKYRGPLHGIPYGAKDLLAVKGYPTTWGAAPYKNQQIAQTATVVRKLEKAGAVLVAKLTLGALAWGDVWFGGKTRNPWNLEQGSSGSSAGSAAATAAGLVGFAIGTETWGSIVSPATRCGVTGLRPTFGRVSRTGAMALSWSMDKIGPICRTARDCALVLQAIQGTDGIDATVVDAPLNYRATSDVSQLRVGYLPAEFEQDSTHRATNNATLATLHKLGFELVPLELPEIPVYDMAFILSAEAAAAFDELTRSGRDSLMVRQVRNAWPNVFRASRFIPAVEYLQANRLRSRLIREMDTMMKPVDLYVAPSFGKNLLLTNLTGHPCLVMPNGFNENGNPTSISFTGRLFGEANLVRIGELFQENTDFHQQHPPEFY